MNKVPGACWKGRGCVSAAAALCEHVSLMLSDMCRWFGVSSLGLIDLKVLKPQFT